VQSSLDREIFEQWSNVVQANQDLDINNRFMVFVWTGYFDRQVLVVRRQVLSKQSVSLVRLMNEVADYSALLSRANFLSGYAKPEYRQSWREAGRLFDSFAGKGGEYVSAARVRADSARLLRVSRRLKYLADKWLAHSDPRRRWPRLGFRELNRALDALYSAWHRYHALVRHSPMNADVKFLARRDWQHVFDIPWRRRADLQG